MDEKTYKRWWQYHLRVARGETLTPAEQVEYEAGVKRLDQEEGEQLQTNGLAALRQARAQIEQLRIVNTQLLAKSAGLDRRIVALEKSYQALTGYPLLTEHATP